ncbi:MAG: hypothetical protein WC119_02915 [Synergistaceae bacterium]
MSDRQADVGSWDTDFPPEEEKNKGNSNRNNRDRIPFMTFDKPGDYTIRLVGNHVRFWRHWQPFTQRVISHINYKDEDPAWQAGFYPRETFAIHIIDRADGKLKILEKGRSLFKQFARYKIVNGENPAGKEGPDWVITVEWPNGNKRQAKYSATATSKTSVFTDEEIEMIKAGKAPLKDIYATTPLDKIKELWEALPDEARVPPKRDEKGAEKAEVKDEASKKVEKVKESMPDSPADAGEDDLFGDDDDTEF